MDFCNVYMQGALLCILVCTSVFNVCLWYEQFNEVGQCQLTINDVKKRLENFEDNERWRERRAVEKSKDTANVEFIHPKLREEMDGQPEDPDNPWVWLTSYSRIPVGCINFSSGDVILRMIPFLRKNYFNL